MAVSDCFSDLDRWKSQQAAVLEMNGPNSEALDKVKQKEVQIAETISSPSSSEEWCGKPKKTVFLCVMLGFAVRDEELWVLLNRGHCLFPGKGYLLCIMGICALAFHSSFLENSFLWNKHEKPN